MTFSDILDAYNNNTLDIETNLSSDHLVPFGNNKFSVVKTVYLAKDSHSSS